MKEMGQQKKQALSKAKTTSSRSSVVSSRQPVAQEDITHPAFMLQQAVGNQATQKLLRSEASQADGKRNQAKDEQAQCQVVKKSEASPEKPGKVKSSQQQKAGESLSNAISYEFDLLNLTTAGVRVGPFTLGRKLRIDD